MEKIIEKIQKLLALASSDNEHEAALAAEKAQALLAQHNLEMADVTGNAAKQPFALAPEWHTKPMPWLVALCSVVAPFYFCAYTTARVRTPDRGKTMRLWWDRHIFLGEAHNLIVCRLMLNYFIDTIGNLCEHAIRQDPEERRTAKYEESFKAACVERLSVRIKERMQTLCKHGDAGANLPALRNTYLAVLDDLEQAMASMGARSRALTLTAHDAQGVEDGAAAANRIGLDVQLEQQKAKQIAG